MIITELLKKLGIADDKLSDAEKAVKEFLDGDFVTKARFNELNEQKKTLSEQLGDRDNQLKELKKGAGDNAELKTQIEALEKANKEQKAAAETRIRELQLDTAVKLAIGDSAQDADIVSSLIDKKKLILGEDGKVAGLTEQVEALKKDRAFLFKTQTPPPAYKPDGGAGSAATNPFAKETYNLTEQGKLLRSNPEQAKAMAAAAGVTIGG